MAVLPVLPHASKARGSERRDGNGSFAGNRAHGSVRRRRRAGPEGGRQAADGPGGASLAAISEEVMIRQMCQHLEFARGVQAQYEKKVADYEQRLQTLAAGEEEQSQRASEDARRRESEEQVATQSRAKPERQPRKKHAEKVPHFSRRSPAEMETLGIPRKPANAQSPLRPAVSLPALPAGRSQGAEAPSPSRFEAVPLVLPSLRMVPASGRSNPVETKSEAPLRSEAPRGLVVWQVLSVSATPKDEDVPTVAQECAFATPLEDLQTPAQRSRRRRGELPRQEAPSPVPLSDCASGSGAHPRSKARGSPTPRSSPPGREKKARGRRPPVLPSPSAEGVQARHRPAQRARRRASGIPHPSTATGVALPQPSAVDESPRADATPRAEGKLSEDEARRWMNRMADNARAAKRAARMADAARSTHNAQAVDGDVDQSAGADVELVDRPSQKTSTKRKRNLSADLTNDMLQGLFARLQDDGEIHRDDLPKALELAGYAEPRREWMCSILDGLHNYATLSYSEFEKFFSAYEDRQDRKDAALFAEVDKDGSGTIDATELSALMVQAGFTPIQRVLEDVIREVSVCDEISYQDFGIVVDKLRQREGFCLSEINDLTAAFRRFDADGDGRIFTRDLCPLLRYLGYAALDEEMASIARDVDVNGEGFLIEREFCVCMRKVREVEIQQIKRILKDPTRMRHGPAVMEVLTDFGYMPEADEVQDAADDAQVHLEVASFDGVWRIIDSYKSRDGFKRAEIKHMGSVFQSFVGSGELCELRVPDLARVFRLLGYSISVGTAQALAARIDVDGSGILNFAELTRLLRIHCRSCSRKGWARCSGGDGSAKQTRHLPEHEVLVQCLRAAVPDALSSELEAEASGLHAIANGDSGRLRVHEFSRSVSRLRSKAREFLRAHEGFSPADVDELRLSFGEYVQKCGDDIEDAVIDGKGLQVLLERFFPDLSKSADQRPHLVELLRKADRDGSGTLDFGEFLILAREVEDLKHQDLVQREAAAIKKTGLSLQEVNDLRDLFLGGDDPDTISLEELRGMLSKVVPMGHKNATALADIFAKVVSEKGEKGGRREADFPEFLTLINRLLETNVADINSFAERAAAAVPMRSPQGRRLSIDSDLSSPRSSRRGRSQSSSRVSPAGSSAKSKAKMTPRFLLPDE